MTVSDAFVAGGVFVLNGAEYTFLAIEDTGRVKATHIGSGIRVSLHPSTECKVQD